MSAQHPEGLQDGSRLSGRVATRPQICLSGGLQTDECTADTHDCWRGPAGVSACQDTFRGFVCHCPAGEPPLTLAAQDSLLACALPRPASSCLQLKRPHKSAAHMS